MHTTKLGEIYMTNIQAIDSDHWKEQNSEGDWIDVDVEIFKSYFDAKQRSQYCESIDASKFVWKAREDGRFRAMVDGTYYGPFDDIEILGNELIAFTGSNSEVVVKWKD
jgi:hypothetical protein